MGQWTRPSLFWIMFFSCLVVPRHWLDQYWSIIKWILNPLRTKFFRGKNIYSYFISFLQIDMTQVVEIRHQVNKSLPFLHCQFHGCWCPGEVRSQVISNRDIYYAEPSKFGLRTLKPKSKQWNLYTKLKMLIQGMYIYMSFLYVVSQLATLQSRRQCSYTGIIYLSKDAPEW